jgi:hypothetical protein
MRQERTTGKSIVDMLLRRQVVEEGGDGAGEGGDQGVRRDLGEGGEDEAALVHLGMWDGQGGLVDDAVAPEEDVQVDRAGAPAGLGGPVAPEPVLDPEEGVEEGAGVEGGAEGGGGVEVEALASGADGECLVEGRACDDVDIWKAVDRIERGEDGGAPITKIGAEGDVNEVGGHA